MSRARCNFRCTLRRLQVGAIVLGVLSSAAPLAGAQENLFRNAGFEQMGNDGRPAEWAPYDFNTGGQFSVGDTDAREGARYVALTGKDPAHRSCWRQHVPWDDSNAGVTVTGWYRTRGVAAAPGKGPSIRFLFNNDPEKWEHLKISTAFYEPSEDWKQITTVFPVPKGTRDLVIELFHWFTPGETHWDSVSIRPATIEELRNVPLDPALAVDREPVFGRNLPYAPADGATVTLNPPPFLWLPSGEDVTYRLQIARDTTFEGAELIERAGTDWCCEMLTAPLAPGTWHWRYGVDRENLPTVWSRARRFEVTADASPWAYPGREKLRVTPERPHLFVSEGRLPELRSRARDGDLKSIADSLVRATRGWAGEELIAEPEWLPKDSDERRKAYVIYIQTTRSPMDRMEQAGLAYLLTGDAQCGEEAKRRLLHFAAWDPSGPSGVFHNDEPAMWVMMRGVRAYDWTYDLFTPAERQLVETSMRARAADFYKLLRGMPFDNNPYSSHPGRIIGFLGEAAIEFLGQWPEATEWLDYITKIYWGVYPAWGKDDGGWNEGPGYWGAYMSFGLHFVVALREATGIDLSQRPFFKSTPYYRLYITPPHAQMSPFGDGSQWLPSRPGALMYWFSTLGRDPAIRWYADALGQDGGASILGVVLKDDTFHGRAPHELPPARLFEGVGLVSLHTDLVNGDEDVHFSMKSSPYGAVSHGHQAQNCFALEAYGEALAILTGYYTSYGSPHHVNWTRETKAKNGITIDGGVGQDRGWQAQGKITDFVHGEGLDLVVGDATQSYGGRLTRAIREVVHVRPGLFVLRDDLASDEPRTFEFRLHAIDEMDVDAASNTVLTQRPRASLTTRFVYPRALVFDQTDQYEPPVTWPPDREYANTWHLSAALPEARTEAQFLTVLMPAKAGEEGDLPSARLLETDTVLGVLLGHRDGASDIVCFRKPGVEADMNVAGVETDASVFALSQSADGLRKAYLIRGGTRFSGQGVELVRGEEPADVTVSWTQADGGRIDTQGPAQTLRVKWPSEPVALTRDGAELPVRYADTFFTVPMQSGRDSVQVWNKEPAAAGAFSLSVIVGDQTFEAEGIRYGRGKEAVSARLNLPPGAYRASVPEGVTFSAGITTQDGVIWMRGDDTVSLSGSRLPKEIRITPVMRGARLPARLQKEMPAGITYEAEKNWGESGGAIQVSGGGHGNVSGGDNLWAWNEIGHTLHWDLDVEKAGRYTIWFVGATQTGLLTELTVDGGDGRALWFEQTGGWGRTAADEWRGYETADADGKPAQFNLAAGRHRLALTNWMGMGLNLDRIVLVPSE